jgi:hypothetical protein
MSDAFIGACSAQARGRFCAAIEGRPVRASKGSNAGEICSEPAPVTRETGHSCFAQLGHPRPAATQETG